MPVNLTLQSETLAGNQDIAAASFITAATDLVHRAITEYAFYDTGSDGGYFVFNGSRVPANTWFYVSPSQLAQLHYVGGSKSGTDNIYVAAWDGQWTTSSTTATASITPAAPTVTAANASVAQAQTLAAQSLIASVSDPNGKAISQYMLMDSGTDGHLFLNGAALTAGQWYTFTAAQLAQIVYRAGTAAGTDTVSIEVSDGGAFSKAAMATITVTVPPPSIASQLQDAGIRADVTKLMVNNSLSYNSMLTILDDAAAGGMTASKFATLQTLAGLLNKSGGIATSAYVQQITDDIVLGSSANATWTGGASSSTSLGNLTATSNAAQAGELIGKWFLGSDLPSLAGTGLAATYQTSTLSLYGSSGAPSYLDVNQGNLGDCYLMSALGEAALRDPTAIEQMITANGNGTYSVRFYEHGAADYVTVNEQLAVMGGGYQWANGSKLEFANGNTDNWVDLIEKAYVELGAQSGVAHGSSGNVYESISGGSAYTLTEITNQSYATIGLSSGMSAGAQNSALANLVADWNAGDLMMLATPSATSGNLIGNHMFEVTSVNSAAGTVSLQNPWNTAYSGATNMAFTESIAQLAADNVTLFASAKV